MQKYSSFFLSIVYCLLSTAIQAQQWHKLGTGVAYPGVSVECLKVIEGDLYVGGGFAIIFGAQGNCIARYNSFTEVWDSVGMSPAYGEVISIEEYKGEIYIGGYIPFGVLEDPNAKNLAKWNDAQWMSVDSAFSNNLNGQIYTLRYKNDLYIGGGFENGNYHLIAKYDGASFDNLQGGIQGWDVWEMEVYKNDLIVAGTFAIAGSVTCSNIARWDGSNWHALGSGLNGDVRALTVDTINDVLYAGGVFTMAGGVQVTGIAKWDGAQWSALPPLPTFFQKGGALSLKVYNGKLYAGLDVISNDLTEIALMYLDNGAWRPLYGPSDWGAGVKALEVYNGNLYVAGGFGKIDTTTVNCIACYGDSCPGTPITLTLPYGVNEVQKESFKFKVYPNPAKRQITIELAEGSRQLAGKEKYMVRIKNSIGQEITQRVIPSGARNLTIDTSQFPKGLLLVEVCSPTPNSSPKERGTVCHTEKVVVE